MNKVVKELVEQAIIYIEPNSDHDGTWAFDKEKFAELIVRDVVNTIKRTQPTTADFEWSVLNTYDLELNNEL
jgi:hypothetical protein